MHSTGFSCMAFVLFWVRDAIDALTDNAITKAEVNGFIGFDRLNLSAVLVNELPTQLNRA